jgi:hypothetical protein
MTPLQGIIGALGLFSTRPTDIRTAVLTGPSTAPLAAENVDHLLRSVNAHVHPVIGVLSGMVIVDTYGGHREITPGTVKFSFHLVSIVFTVFVTDLKFDFTHPAALS